MYQYTLFQIMKIQNKITIRENAVHVFYFIQVIGSTVSLKKVPSTYTGLLPNVWYFFWSSDVLGDFISYW